MLSCMCLDPCHSHRPNLTTNRGDTFVIISRARGWWVVQRDPEGTGIVDSDTTKQGWVPAGCLLETRIPVATAIAEASHVSGTSSQPSSPVPITKTPILPLHIVSTSFPGYALMDYKKKGDEELDLFKDDVLRVFKRYNHWSYVRLLPVALL
jgi:protein STE50